eukprot:scaffold191948_cov35-Tisochrysis_lutea.AAC.1
MAALGGVMLCGSTMPQQQHFGALGPSTTQRAIGHRTRASILCCQSLRAAGRCACQRVARDGPLKKNFLIFSPHN